VTTASIIAIYVVVDEAMKAFKHQSHSLAHVSDAEVITIALVAAAFYRNNHAQAIFLLRKNNYITKSLSVSRFSRRLHALGEWLELLSEVWSEIIIREQAAIATFIIDSMPIPICKNIRASQSRLLRGKEFFGRCGYKHKEKFFGLRLHIVCTLDKRPVSFTLLPASYDDRTPVHDLTVNLPLGSWVLGDKGYNCAEAEEIMRWTIGGILIPLRKDNMPPNTLAEHGELRSYRHRIEQLFSQLESMGLKSLHVTTPRGLELKTYASLAVVALLNTPN